MMPFRTIILVAMIVLVRHPACAEDFPVAVTKALSQLPDGADVAGMGNASTATPAFSSRNPAIVAVETEDKSTLGVMGTYGNISFGNGLDINLYIVTGSARLPFGAVQVSYSNGASNTGTLAGGDTFKANNTPSFELQYGVKLRQGLLGDDALYAGVSYGYATSRQTFNLATMTPGDTVLTTEGASHTAGAGLLYQIAKKINFGMLWLHTWDRTENTTVIPAVSFLDKTDASSHGDHLRLGISLQATPMTLLAADYRHLYLAGGKHDDQYFAGIEQGIIKDLLYLYGGWADGGTTAGLGVYLRQGGLNLAYMHRPLRSLEEFFGRADILMTSLYLNF